MLKMIEIVLNKSLLSLCIQALQGLELLLHLLSTKLFGILTSNIYPKHTSIERLNYKRTPVLTWSLIQKNRKKEEIRERIWSHDSVQVCRVYAQRWKFIQTFRIFLLYNKKHTCKMFAFSPIHFSLMLYNAWLIRNRWWKSQLLFFKTIKSRLLNYIVEICLKTSLHTHKIMIYFFAF